MAIIECKDVWMKGGREEPDYFGITIPGDEVWGLVERLLEHLQYEPKGSDYHLGFSGSVLIDRKPLQREEVKL